MAWEVCKRSAAAMLILLKVRRSNENIRQSAAFPALQSSGERIDDL